MEQTPLSITYDLFIDNFIFFFRTFLKYFYISTIYFFQKILSLRNQTILNRWCTSQSAIQGRINYPPYLDCFRFRLPDTQFVAGTVAPMEFSSSLSRTSSVCFQEPSELPVDCFISFYSLVLFFRCQATSASEIVVVVDDLLYPTSSRSIAKQILAIRWARATTALFIPRRSLSFSAHWRL